MQRELALQWRDFVSVAESLADGDSPSDAALRRARSTAYYALFHHLARSCADLLIGEDVSDRSKHAWHQAYRGLEHNEARKACSDAQVLGKFPDAIQDYGNEFKGLQARRHKADYDPYVEVVQSEVRQDIANVRQVIEAFDGLDRKDRSAFCAYVLLKRRKD